MGQAVLEINLKLKNVYDTLFPFKDRKKSQEALEKLAEFERDRSRYQKELKLQKAIDHVAIYKSIADKWISKKLANFDLKKFIHSSAAGGADAVRDMKTALFGSLMTTGGSIIGGMIGSFFLPPIGTILGSLAGWGLGALAKQAYVNSEKEDKAYEFAIGYLRDYKSDTRSRRNVRTSELYSSLQESLRTKEDTGSISEQEMRTRISAM